MTDTIARIIGVGLLIATLGCGSSGSGTDAAGASGAGGAGTGGAGTGGAGAGGSGDCLAPAGCCALNSDCASTEECVNASCAAGQMTAGVCKPKPTTSGTCWSDADCPLRSCAGAQVCPCGAACLVADTLGSCGP